MASAVSLRRDDPAAELRRLAATTRNANQSRRLLSLAAVLDGMNRTAAARIGGMDRQTLRDWVHRFNEHGPEGLLDSWSKGPAPRLSAEQRAEIAQLVETGPDRAVHGYTAYGDTINIAARLESANKQFGTRVCVSWGKLGCRQPRRVGSGGRCRYKCGRHRCSLGPPYLSQHRSIVW